MGLCFSQEWLDYKWQRWSVCSIFWGNMPGPDYHEAKKLNSVRSPFFYQEIQFFHEPSMAPSKIFNGNQCGRKIQWEASDEQISTENFSFQCFISKYGYSLIVSYLEILELRYFFRKSKKLTPVRLEPSTSRYLVRCFIHCATEPVDIAYKWFLYNTKTTVKRSWYHHLQK